MARRVAYRNPLSGRFIAAENAFSGDVVRIIFEDGIKVAEDLLQDGRLVTLDQEIAEPNWEVRETERSIQWTNDDDSLRAEALQDADFPVGVTSFRVLYSQADNPDYPQGYSSSDWQLPDQWPPRTDFDNMGSIVGIARIFFERER